MSSILNIQVEEIESVEFLNPIQYNESIDTKETILDLRIKLNNKSIVIVKLQEGIKEGLDKGVEKGGPVSITNLMDSTKWSAQQTMDALKISKDDQVKIRPNVELIIPSLL